MSVKGFGNPLSEKASKGVARCLLTGVAALVLSFLLWKTVMVIVPHPPLSFHLTTGIFAMMTLVGTSLAIRRLNVPKSEKRATPLPHHRKTATQKNILIGVAGTSSAVSFGRN